MEVMTYEEYKNFLAVQKNYEKFLNANVHKKAMKESRAGSKLGSSYCSPKLLDDKKS